MSDTGGADVSEQLQDLVHSPDVTPTGEVVVNPPCSLTSDDEARLQQLSDAVAAAGPSQPRRGGSEDQRASLGADAAEDNSTKPDPITGKIDAVDVSARIAMLDKLKADMERNFIMMKRAYGGPPSRKKPAAAPPPAQADEDDSEVVDRPQA